MDVEGPAGSATSAAVEKGGIGVYLWNPVTSELSWDETLASMFRADRAGEQPFQTWLRRVHPDDRERVLATFAEFREAEDIYRLVMDDGRTRHILARATHVIRDQDGDPVSVCGVMLDVTETQQAGARLKAMMDSMSDGFLVLDRDYRFTFLNRRAEFVLGMPAKALIGQVVWDAFPHAVGTVFEVSYRTVMNDREPVVFEEYYPGPLNMWMEVRAQPSEDGLLVYFQDVSDRHARHAERDRLLELERRARSEAETARRDAEQAQRQLSHQARHDPLTGLVNRSELERLAAQSLATLDLPLVALFLDLDRFKLVNDSLGHAVGDGLLVEIGNRIRAVLRADDVAARLGGDEFVVLLEGSAAEEAQQVAERLLAEVREPAVIGEYTVSTTVSIGLAAADAGTTVATLLRDADVALYRAKDAGRDGYAWFDTQAHEDPWHRVALEADLRTALDRDGIQPHYQPMFSLSDERLVGVEALARWHHPERGPVPPSTFIPLAEDVGLIKQLGAGIARAAIDRAARWSDLPDFTVWVNVSGRQLNVPGFAQMLLRDLADAGLPPHRLGVEVTESVLADEAVAVGELAELSAAGVPIAIDDFGTGYSSLARLAVLPISVLKVDRSFVANIETAHGRASVDVIVHLARSLGLRTVAEGIETPRQLQLVREAGVDSAAGYLLGRPAPPEALDAHVLTGPAATPL